MAVGSRLGSYGVEAKTALDLLYERMHTESATIDGSDELLTAGEVATLLRMTAAWVYSETRGNRIPHMRLGRYVRYRRSTIIAWMSDLEAASDRVHGADMSSRRASRRRG